MVQPAQKPPPEPAASSRPPGWGADELTAFIEAAHRNQYATFFRKRPATQRLVAIDSEFAKVTKGWVNPASEILAMLFVRCHGAFRTSAGLAMAGQAAETYVQCRAMLEQGAYAVHIHRDPSLGMVWLDRHESVKQMAAQKSTFSYSRVAASVAAANRHAGKRFEDLYQRTIDFGGHPNERSITGNMKMVEEADRRVMQAVLQHEDGPELDMALKTVAQCGMVALEMFQVIYNAKFELIGVNAAMLELRKGL
jgi:Zn-finger nucleic acid-binding protein